MKRTFSLKVVDKNIEKGCFSRTYIITFQDEGGKLNYGRPFPLDTSAQQYYSCLMNSILPLNFTSSDEGKTWSVIRK